MRGEFKNILVSCWFCIAVITVPGVLAGGKTVARVTDLAGDVSEVSNGISRPLRILARVTEGSVIELAPSTSLTLHFASNRTDLRFFGPATVTVFADHATSSNGISAKKEHKEIDISIDLKNSDLGGVISRSISIDDTTITPVHPVGTKIIAGRPVSFFWEADTEDAKQFNFELSHVDGGLIYAVSTSHHRVNLSQELALQPGTTYHWSVSYLQSSEDNVIQRNRFETASIDESNIFYSLLGLARGTVSDLVLYALTLEQMGLVGEAEEVWKNLESHHPGIKQER